MRASTAIAILILGAAPSLHAHATLLSPKPRTKLTLKDGPCGGVRRTNQPLELEAGSEIEVSWEEYVDHPGFYRILFSKSGDTGFAVLLDNISDRKATFEEPILEYTARVTLPDEPCDDCTLQLIQVMMETPSAPKYYYSCADLRLTVPAPLSNEYLRGDANADGQVDVSDAVRTFIMLFSGGAAPACADASDSNDDGRVDVSDGIFLLRWLFTAGDEPSAPGALNCGSDPTEDPLPECLYSTAFCGQG